MELGDCFPSGSEGAGGASSQKVKRDDFYMMNAGQVVMDFED